MVRRLALLALAALVLAGCGSAEAVPPEAAATHEAAGADEAITGTGLDGEPISFAEFRGRPLLVNVWSSW
jgi:ABC-type glycerol-3-phosphate transport system substrate-binding protein